MAAEREREGSQALELERFVVQRLLRGGVALSAALMALGLLLLLLGGSRDAPAFELRALFAAGTVPGERLMGAGILVLAMTPALRVLVLLWLWTRERDLRFVAVALAVIATLAAAMALGGG